MKPAAATAYLDHLHWVGLARANTGHKDGLQFIDTLEYLRGAVADGRVALPLSSTHYAELLQTGSYRQRTDVATVMAELSGFCTISGIGPVRAAEIDQAVFKRFGRPESPRTVRLFGRGAFFAFGRNTEEHPLARTAALLARRLGPAEASRIMAEADRQLEFGLLRGPSSAEQEELRKDPAYQPERFRKMIEDNAAFERDLADQLVADPKWNRRLGDIIAARTLVNEVGPELFPRLAELGIDAESEFLARGREWLTDFVDDLPSVAVIVILGQANHKTTGRPWSRNDIHDVNALALAVPYCDIVVTEAHAHAQLHRAKAEERFNTKIIRKLDELPELVERSA